MGDKTFLLKEIFKNYQIDRAINIGIVVAKIKISKLAIYFCTK